MNIRYLGKMTRNKILFSLLSLLFIVPLQAQTIDEARALYAHNKYEEAKPMFEKFLKSYPNNPNYNFWYGVSALKTGESDKAIKPLELANKRRVPDAAYYLGQAYLANYQFDEAVDVLESYIKTQQRRKKDTSDLEDLLQQTKLNQRMLKGVEQVIVIDSIVVDKADFIQNYKLSEESGSLTYITNQEVDSTGQKPILYQTERGNKRYLSKKNASGFYQLFAQTKLGEEWTEEKALSDLNKDSINTSYPFVLNDGITLFYASDSQELMGGYDILVTRYNTNTDGYLVPENVGMPFNSFYNDYMYVIDEFNNLGWFASDRFQPKDKVCIYIFIPNKVKRTYDFETTPIEELRNLAALKNIKLTWKDKKAVEDGLQRLKFAINYQPKQTNNADFNFIVNDQFVYTSLRDFKSNKAREEFIKYQVMEKDLTSQKDKLKNLRIQFEKNPDKQKAPAILDLEKRVSIMHHEMQQQAKLIRSLELQ